MCFLEEEFVCESLTKSSFLAGGGDDFANYEPPARAANSPPSRPQPVRKSCIKNFTKNCGRNGGGERNAGGGGLAVGDQPEIKIFNTLIKKARQELKIG